MRLASPWAAWRSTRVYGAPAARTSVRAPSTWPRPTSGTIMAERIPSSVTRRVCSSPRATRPSANSSASATISGCASASTRASASGSSAPDSGLLLELPGHRLERGIDVRDDEPADLAAVLDEIDLAPVGQRAGDEPGETGQRGLVVERAREHPADLGEQRVLPGPVLGLGALGLGAPQLLGALVVAALLLGDVAHDDQTERRRPARPRARWPRRARTRSRRGGSRSGPPRRRW